MRLFLFLFLVISTYGGESVVHILHTCDIHGHAINKEGGFLRLAGCIEKQRQILGRERVILIDCGDTIQGSFSASIDRGELALSYLNTLKYDAWILGNHELDFGAERLDDLIERAQVPVMSANFKPKDKDLRQRVLSWRLIERGGLRVALIGLQSDRMPLWFSPKAMGHWQMLDTIWAVEDSLREIRQVKPDIVVLAGHLGLGNPTAKKPYAMSAIARRFPEIRLLIGGHTHQNVPGRKIYQSFFSQAGKHGRRLGINSIFFDETTKLIHRITGRLIIPSQSPSIDIFPSLRQSYEKLNQKGREVVASIPQSVSFEGLPGRDCQFTEMLSQLVIAKTSADIVLQGKFRSGIFNQKSINRRQLHEFLPYENHLFFIDITKDELKNILAEQDKLRDSKHFQGLHGLSWQPGDKVNLIWPNSTETLRLAVNSYVANSGGGKFPYLAELIMKKGIESKINIRDLFEAGLKEGFGSN